MALKIPSLQYLLDAAATTFLKFPMAILSAILAAVCAIIITEGDSSDSLTVINLMLTGALGIPLFVGTGLVKQRISGWSVYILYAIATLILLLVFLTLPEVNSTFNRSRPYFRYAVYNAVAHLFVAIAPYYRMGELNGFWNYNKSLFLRFLLTLLYSIALYAGIALALFAVDTLFDADLDSELYLDVFIVIIFVFNTWFFAAGLPQEYGTLEATHSYPKGLRIFCQFILVPLLVIYLIILYVYGAKIILTWDWPEGIVSYLIMIISVTGILTMLLLHPYACEKGSEWIRILRRVFYILLLPLVILLFLAIGIRIADYGFTVNRYLILLSGIWITIAAVYAILRPLAIKFLPASLGILFFLGSFGYWGMFSVSERDQTARLHAILTENGLLENDKIVNEVIWVQDSLPRFYSPDALRNNEILSDSAHNEVISILQYLDEYHGFERIEPWFSQDIGALTRQAYQMDSEEDIYNVGDETDVFANSLGIQEFMKNSWRNEQVMVHLLHEEGREIMLKEYKYLTDLPEMNFQRYVTSKSTFRKHDFWTDNEGTKILFNPTSFHLSCYRQDSLRYTFDLSRVFEQIGSKENYSSGEYNEIKVNLRFPAQEGNAEIVLFEATIKAYSDSSDFYLQSMDPVILTNSMEEKPETNAP